MNLAELTIEGLKELASEKRAAFDALIAEETPTEEQIAEAEGLAGEIEEIDAELASRPDETSLADRHAALKNRFASSDEEDEEDPEDEGDEEPEEEETEEATSKPAEKKTAAKSSRVRSLAKKTERPAVESEPKSRVSITASADVPGFATGSEMDMDKVAKAVVNRMRGFSPPQGRGESENLMHFGVASFGLDFDESLTASGGNDLEVFNRAANEKRLEGDSLTAAGGWCAPSETIYDLCDEGETLEGLISVPEVNITRGGIRYTRGPSFSDIYNNTGFLQTEADAIAGTEKTCFEVDCPSFDEVRLDAIGLCIKAPILTNAAYPEIVRRYVTGSMIAHQHKVSAEVISRMVAAAGTPYVPNGIGSVAADTLGILEVLADRKRQEYRLGLGATLEVVLPFWVKGAIRNDLQNRTGQIAPVSDQQVTQHFSARNLNVQFVYNWQPLAWPDDPGTTGVDESTIPAYPDTVDALMYPAGAYVKGTSDVINMNAVYDAAELVQNIYTALFFEQGLLVAQTCFDADVVTIPICAAGRTGAADLVCADGTWA